VSPPATIKMRRGETPEFEVSTAGLNGEEVEEVSWDLSGSGQYVAYPGSSGLKVKVPHPYLTPGQYAVGLKVVLKGNGNFGNPPTVTDTLVVEVPLPTARFEVFPAVNGNEPLQAGENVKPGEEVKFNASASEDPTGGPEGEETNALETYTWTFGNGEMTTSSTPLLTRSFSNTSSEPRPETVMLTVANKDGGELVESLPVTQKFTIAGTPTSVSPPSQNPPVNDQPTVPPVKSPVSSPPAKKTLTRAQKLAKALKECKKDHAKRVRAACERKARRLYGSRISHKPKKR
jgi:hypothetical protein